MQHEFNVFQCDLMQWWCTTIEFENLLQIQAWFFRSKRLEFILKFVKYVIKQQYSREQKHVLLSRKSDFLIFKVSNSNMPQIFLGTKLFCLLSKWAEKKRYLTNTWCVCQVAGISKRSNDREKSFFPKKNRRVTIRDCKKSDFLNSNTC